ncbi:MAG: potassium channel protein [Armatimonadetes bacterium]|nr:potassium channel protein [Armatimonadota bacterium]
MKARFWVGLGGLLGLLAMAVAGYRYLLGWDARQALFFTLITITTIGYNDYGLTPAARDFTALLIVVGIASWTLLLTAGAEYVAAHWEGTRRRRMERELEGLRNHFVVVGYGPVGREVAELLHRAGRRVLVVDMDPVAVERARAKGMAALQGDATQEETLREAGLARAAGILSVTRNDPVNVFVTLCARGMSPGIFIAANAIAAGVEEKLRRAGATVVISPYEIGAQRLAMTALSPHAAELFEGYAADSPGGLRIREAILEAGSTVCGKRLRDSGLREQSNVMLVAVKGAGGGELTVNPSADRVLSAGDILIGLGRAESVDAFAALVAPRAMRELGALE